MRGDVTLHRDGAPPGGDVTLHRDGPPGGRDPAQGRGPGGRDPAQGRAPARGRRDPAQGRGPGGRDPAQGRALEGCALEFMRLWEHRQISNSYQWLMQAQLGRTQTPLL